MNSNYAPLWSFLRRARALLVLLAVAVALFPLGVLALLERLLAVVLRVLAQHTTVLLLMGLLGLAWGLSGCGTVPLPAPTRPLVPAVLLIPPAQPVPLTLGSGLKRPGPTTPPTPKAVPRTGLGTSN